MAAPPGVDARRGGGELGAETTRSANGRERRADRRGDFEDLVVVTDEHDVASLGQCHVGRVVCGQPPGHPGGHRAQLDLADVEAECMESLGQVDLSARRISLVGKDDKARVVPIAPPLVNPASMDVVESDDDDDPVEDALPDHDGNGAEQDDAAGFERWRKESALGAVGTGIARGLHSVFAAPVDEVVIVAAVPGDPPDADQRVRVILDPDDPTKSVAIMPDNPADPPPD